MRGWPLTCVAIFACSDQSAVLPWPTPAPEDRSYVLIYADGPSEHAAAVSRGGRFVGELPAASRLALLIYTESLADLALEEGPFDLAQACRSCSLLEPSRVFSAGGDFESWTPSSIDDAIAEALVPDREARCDFCAPLTVTHVEVPGTREIRFGERLDRGQALLGGNEALFVVDGDSRIEQLCAATRTFESAHFDGRGLWLASAGSLFVMDLEAQRTRPATATCSADLMTVTGTATTQIRWMDGSSIGDPPELYLANDQGRIGHRDASGWRWIDRAPFSLSELGSVLWRGPGRAFVALDTPFIHHVDGDIVRREPTPVRATGSRPEVSDVIETPELGLVLGTRGTGLLLKTSGGWSATAEGTNIVTGLAPLGEGVALVQRGLVVSHYSKRTGHCPEYAPLEGDKRNIDGNVVIAFDGGIVVGDVTESRLPPLIAVLKAPATACR